jgi:adenylate cyclase class 2
MSVEIEAKMKVKDLSAVRRKLADVGAAREGSVLEVNTFFDTEDRNLLAGDRGLRLRQQRSLDGGGDEEFIITYKGPRQAGPVKSREEIEVRVLDGDRTVTLFEKLGYRRVLSFQKRRESWSFNGCSVVLDELPHLGTYVEIEGPNEQIILATREQLGLAHHPLVKASYIALLMAYLQEKGNAQRIIVFPDDAGQAATPG